MGPLLITFFISIFILLMQFLWKWIEDFIGKGLEWNILVEILIYASAGLVPMALPLAVLLASVMTFGNLGENYELTAMKSAGISLLKIMSPLMILIVMIAIGAFFFSNNALPYTNMRMANVLYDVTRKRPELNIKTNVFNNDIEGYSIKIEKKNKKNNIMYDFMIYNHTKRLGNQEVVLADSGEISITNDQKHMIITLYDGHNYTEMREKKRKDKEYPYRHDKFKEQTMIFELVGFELKRSSATLFKDNYQMMDLTQLTYSIDSLSESYNIKKLNLQKRLKKFNYFRYEYKVPTSLNKKKKETDSLRKYASVEKLFVNLNLDSIFESMEIEKKFEAVGLALNNANKTLSNIETSEKSLHDNLKWLRKHQLARYRKFSLSFACIIFFFIGAPLGAIIRKGGFGLPILVSAVLFMFYYVVSITGEKFVREDVMPVAIGALLSSAVLFPLGVFLTYKASHDSVLFDSGKYLQIVKRILQIAKLQRVFKSRRLKK